MGVLTSSADCVIFAVICCLDVMAIDLQPLLLQKPSGLVNSQAPAWQHGMGTASDEHSGPCPAVLLKLKEACV